MSGQCINRLTLASPALPGQSFWKWVLGWPRTRAPDAYTHQTCTLNMYGRDPVVRGYWGSGKNAAEKRAYLRYTHTRTHAHAHTRVRSPL